MPELSKNAKRKMKRYGYIPMGMRLRQQELREIKKIDLPETATSVA